MIEETGRRKTKHHQWLKDDIGHPALDRHFSGVMALMRVNTNWALLFWPDAMSYFIEQVTEADPDFLQSGFKVL